MRPLLAIDPGASGGFAWMDGAGLVCCEPMPEGMTQQADKLRELSVDLCFLSHGTELTQAVMEKTGTYVPGNSGPSAATFARHCGHLDMALYLLGFPTEQVYPTVWQKFLGELPKEKPERKRAIKELMARRYPHLQVTLRTADALGILTWAMSKRTI